MVAPWAPLGYSEQALSERFSGSHVYYCLLICSVNKETITTQVFPGFFESVCIAVADLVHNPILFQVPFPCFGGFILHHASS